MHKNTSYPLLSPPPPRGGARGGAFGAPEPAPRGGAAGAFPPPIERLGAPEPHDDSRESPLASAGMANSTMAPESSIEKRERIEKLKKSLQNAAISLACFTGGSAVFGPLPYLGAGGVGWGGERRREDVRKKAGGR